MSIALIAHPSLVAGDVDPLERLVAHDPWFSAAARGGASLAPSPTPQPASPRSLTVEWLVARDIDTYRARRRGVAR